MLYVCLVMDDVARFIYEEKAQNLQFTEYDRYVRRHPLGRGRLSRTALPSDNQCYGGLCGLENRNMCA